MIIIVSAKFIPAFKKKLLVIYHQSSRANYISELLVSVQKRSCTVKQSVYMAEWPLAITSIVTSCVNDWWSWVQLEG